MDDTDISWNMCLTFSALNYDGSSYLNMGWEGNIGSNFIITYWLSTTFTHTKRIWMVVIVVALNLLF